MHGPPPAQVHRTLPLPPSGTIASYRGPTLAMQSLDISVQNGL